MYGVYRGKQGSKIYQTWAEAETVTKGVSGAKVCKFKDKDAASQFCTTGMYPSNQPVILFNSPLIDSHINVYTDGSALQNGKAGIGVHFANKLYADLSEAFNKPPNTNQRAELWAVIRALQVIRENHVNNKTKIIIHTDSRYVIGCARDWVIAWRTTDFRNNTICNRDLIAQLWNEIENAPLPLDWIWVKGHADCVGNIQADRLAISGSQK